MIFYKFVSNVFFAMNQKYQTNKNSSSSLPIEEAYNDWQDYQPQQQPQSHAGNNLHNRTISSNPFHRKQSQTRSCCDSNDFTAPTQNGFQNSNRCKKEPNQFPMSSQTTTLGHKRSQFDGHSSNYQDVMRSSDVKEDNSTSKHEEQRNHLRDMTNLIHMNQQQQSSSAKYSQKYSINHNLSTESTSAFDDQQQSLYNKNNNLLGEVAQAADQQQHQNSGGKSAASDTARAKKQLSYLQAQQQLPKNSYSQSIDDDKSAPVKTLSALDDVANTSSAKHNHLEQARIARQRIDLNTISEPLLVSFQEDQNTSSSASFNEFRILPYKQQQQTLTTTQESGERNLDENFMEKAVRKQLNYINNNISCGFIDENYASENRIRQFQQPQQNDDLQESCNIKNNLSCYQEKDNSDNLILKLSTLEQEIGSNLAFKSQQHFQMNRNQNNQNTTAQSINGGVHGGASSGSHSQSQHQNSIAAHFYAKHYAQQNQSQTNGRASSKLKQFKQEHQQASRSSQAEKLNKTQVDHQSQIANYLTAQPSQTMMYGRRDNSKSNQLQSSTSHAQNNLQTPQFSQYGATATAQKVSNIQQLTHEQQQQRTSNLLQKNSKESYFNQLHVSGLPNGGDLAGVAQSSSTFVNKSGSRVDDTNSKQQMIQNLNQRYLTQNQPASHQHHQTIQHQANNFDNTNMSTQMTSESLKVTATKPKQSRQPGKSQTQHTTTGATNSHAHSTTKHTHASKAKTTSQLQQRKSSTSYYSSSNHHQQSQNVAQSSNNSHAAMYTSNRGLQHQPENRPHTSQGGYLQSHHHQVKFEDEANNRSFTGTGNQSSSYLKQQSNNLTAQGGVDQSSSSKNIPSKGRQSSTLNRPSTSHNIKGRNLNSNHVSTHQNTRVSNATKTTSVNDLNGSNVSQILAVNLLPTSQPKQFSGTATNSTTHQNKGQTSIGNKGSSHTQQRPSTALRPRSSAQLKSGPVGASSNSKSSLQPARVSINNTTSSALGTAKSGSRIESSNLKSNAAQIKKNNHSTIVMRDDDDSILDLKHIEEMMRASQKSNIFSVIPNDINDPHQSAARDTINASNFNDSATRHNASIMTNNVAINSPSQVQMPQQQTPEMLQKAKLRLETVCLLLGENSNPSISEKEKQQCAVSNVLDEIIYNQPNKFDSQCLHLLMDYQWQSASNSQTFKLQEELSQIKNQFLSQQQLSLENKELKEQLAKQKHQLQDQGSKIHLLEFELNQVKKQFEVDSRETRVRSSLQVQNTSQQTTQQQQQQQQKQSSRQVSRAVSQQNNRRSSTLQVPLLDLSKVKAYEDHVRDKANQKNTKEKSQVKPSSASVGVAKVNEAVAKNKTSSYMASLEKSGTGQVPQKAQMSTIQHQSTKVNNFVGGEVNLMNLNTLGASSKHNNSQPRNSQKLDQQYSQQRSTIDPTSHSMSPSAQGKGRNQSYLSHMRHSQENRSTQQQHYSTNQEQTEINASFDQVREHHNYSATIEGSRIVQEQQSNSRDSAAFNTRKQVNDRKSSVPPSQVHIPLLDFTKLHKPQQPTQSRAATKAMQPKQSQSQQHSKYQTIDAGGHKSGVQGYNQYGAHQHMLSQQAQTIQHNGSSSQKDYQRQIYQKKSGASYEHLNAAGINTTQLQQLRQSHDSSRQQRVTLALKESGNIGVSQSVKVMAPQSDEAHLLQLQYNNSSSNASKKNQQPSNNSQINPAATAQKTSAQSQSNLKYGSNQTYLNASKHLAMSSTTQNATTSQQQQKQQEIPKQQMTSFKSDFNNGMV